MAPELITGEPVDARTDLYALGAVLYAMLTGLRPVDASTVAGFLARHLSEVPVPPGEIDPTVPPLLDRIAMRLLQKSPDKRFPSARAVLAALDGEDADHRPVRGRDGALERLGAAAASVRIGVPVSLLVTGPPGSGRSTLLDEARRLAAASGLSVRTASARQGNVGPFLVDDAGDTTDPSQLGSWAERLGRRPRALVIDDADEAEPAAMQLALEVVGRAARGEGSGCLVVLSAGAGADALAARFVAAGVPEPARVELGPLDRPSVAALVRDRGVTGPVAPVLARRLHREWAGNPGSVHEQIDALVAAEWLQRQRDSFVAARPVDAFRRDDLPVPIPVVERHRHRIEPLPDHERAVVEVLALCGRPVSAHLVAAALEQAGDDLRVERLLRVELVARTVLEGVECLELRDPALARTALFLIDPAQRMARSRAIASTLAARRRSDPIEVAHHWTVAGEPARAFPLLVTAARRGARGRSATEVADLVERAAALQDVAEANLPPADFLAIRVWLRLLQGEAALGRGAWGAARTSIEGALADAVALGDTAAIGRCQAALGRAHYRAGDFAAARAPLEAALEAATGEDRAAALRALADLDNRDGDFVAAEARWRSALSEAPSADAEARAHRGLADVLVLTGHLVEGAEHLARAEDQLGPDGDPRVRASVLVRTVELDLVAASWGAASSRLDNLHELLRSANLHERSAEAWAFRAALGAALGDTERVVVACRNAHGLCRVPGVPAWRIHAICGGALADVGRFEEAARLSLVPDAAPPSPLEDPPGWVASVAARIEVHRNPARAIDHARWALTRAPRLIYRRIDLSIQASAALEAAGLVDEATAARRAALEVVTVRAGLEGQRLRLLVDLWRTSREAMWADAARSALQAAADRAGGLDLGALWWTEWAEGLRRG
jgi:tetratricopeptide (TPR) repeat protein